MFRSNALPADDLHVAVTAPQSQSVTTAAHDAPQGAAPSRVAMIICHGMGQQVAFETLDCVAKSLLGAEKAARGAERTAGSTPAADVPAAQVNVKIVRLGSEQLPRAELTVTTPAGPREVHLYEAYWAPLTEGKVTALDVTRFLFDAWLRGMKFAAAGRFSRFIFGKDREFAIPRSSGVKLMGAFLGVALVWLAFLAIWLAAPVWIGANALRGAWGAGGVVTAVLGWTVAAYLSLRGREIYFQYAGDVAAYVSSHKVNRFYEVRSAVKKVGQDLARAVYGARAADGGEEYAEVYVVGHSLGSVVAYDTLNAMLNEERLGAGGLRVRERTPMLLTFGSPLNKTAFIFRTQLKDAPVREALAAAMQPMISDYALRPNHWVNIYSPHDPVSSALTFYDTPDPDDTDPLFRTRRVLNLRDPLANTPAVAHVQYWDNPLLGTTLHRAISGLTPVPAVQTAGQVQPGVPAASGAKIAGA